MEFKIKEKIEKGYSLDLGKLIEDCFEIYKKTFLIAGLGLIIVGIVVAILYAFLFMALMGVSNIADWAIEMQNLKLEKSYLLGSFFVGVVFAALIAPLNAGFFKLCLLAKKNQELNLGVIFEYYNSKYVKDIIIGAIIISISSSLISTIFQFFPLSITGFLFQIIGFGIQIIITVLTILFLPLVIFANQNYGEALQNSVKLVAKKPFHIVLALFIAFIGMFLGLIALCIGMFFTIPIYIAMIFSIYDNVVGFEESSVIDEIGQIEE